MSGRDRDPDDLLRDGGGDIGDLYRRLPRYEPPRRLDRAVLGEAARAVHSGKPPRRQRWMFGVGSAAGLVLAAGIAWRIGHDAMDRNGAELAPPPATRVVPVHPIDESARATRAQEAPAQPASEAQDANAQQETGRAAGDQAARNEAKPVLRKSRAPSATVLSTATPEPPKPAPAAAPPPTAFPQSAPAAEAPADRERADAARAGKAESAAAGGLQKRASGLTREATSPTPPSSSVELQRDMQLAPPDWLAHVRELRRQGRTQQAIESLRLFRRAHPDRTIPADLRDLLE